MITLQLSDVWYAPKATDEQIGVIKRELTVEDCEYYDRIGWKHFRDEDLIERNLPELGNEIYLNSNNCVIELRGKRYEFEFDDYSNLYGEDLWEAGNKNIVLTPTEKPLSESKNRGWYRFFGQPHWIQSDYYPLDLNGNLCYHLLTVNNDWGDAGNFNILIGFDSNDVPNVAYFEASCH